MKNHNKIDYFTGFTWCDISKFLIMKYHH